MKEPIDAASGLLGHLREDSGMDTEELLGLREKVSPRKVPRALP